uniref:Uncharacterized protein n=1 Tax=Arundo donax TaxID=35708 RepID=A0A0A8ZNI7_ARUDO
MNKNKLVNYLQKQ